MNCLWKVDLMNKVFLMGVFLVLPVTLCITANEQLNSDDSIESSSSIVQVVSAETVSIVESLEQSIVSEPVQEISKTDLGSFTITAYCACKKCCGKWALNRPNGIVYGAAGIELISGLSVASNAFEFGTELEIDGYGKVIVHDRTAEWVYEKYKGKIVDIYFNTHEEAVKFAKQTRKVFIYENQEGR